MEYTCPHCKKPIYDEEALLCLYCGESLGRGGSGLLGNMKYSVPRVVVIIAVVLVLISFIILFTR